MNDTRLAVLEALADGPVSGPDLADRLGVSRAAIWNHVEALRNAGFDVESQGEGYHLASIPEYGGLAVEYELAAPYEVEYHESIDSTNDRARELAGEGADGVVVLADEQTGGRGRLDRAWNSPSGGVWLSLVIRPDLPPAHAPVLTLAAAVAVATAAREREADAAIKWPNDVLVGDRKLAGVLTEMEGEADRVSWVVVGVGVNANVDGEALPESATSLQVEVGDVERRAFVQDILESFHDMASDPEGVVPAWRDLSATLGQRVRVETPTGEVVGEAVDVEFPGTLVVETESGIERVHTGDCEHLRPVSE